MPALPIDTSQIVITASRAPESEGDTPASVTIIDSKEIERLGEPLLPSFLRLTPSAAVEVGGPAGSFAEVRIRGAEANHTLLFIDGIRANGGDAPDFRTTWHKRRPTDRQRPDGQSIAKRNRGNITVVR